ncbi:MAG: hypothetical protein WC389_20310 [Lutibacter sp.]|jgi:hypothetical protein
MKNLIKTNRTALILIILTLALTTATRAQNKKSDTLLYLPVSKGQQYTAADVQSFHESDFLLSTVENSQQENEYVMTY